MEEVVQSSLEKSVNVENIERDLRPKLVDVVFGPVSFFGRNAKHMKNFNKEQKIKYDFLGTLFLVHPFYLATTAGMIYYFSS